MTKQKKHKFTPPAEAPAVAPVPVTTPPAQPVKKTQPKPLTRLQVGDMIRLGREDYVVWLVNECRAACVPVTSRAQTNSINISPNSEVEILERLGKAKMIEFLEGQKTKGPMKEKKEKQEKDTTPKLGKLGGFLGHPITAVIRAMGHAKWEYWEARKVFTDEKIEVADNTIRIQLSKGKNGEGEPAPVAKELKDLRPDPADKPARAAAGTAKNKGKSKQQLVEEEEAEQEAASKKAKSKGSSKKAKKESEAEEGEDEPDFEDGQD